VNSIIPVIDPSDAEIEEALNILKMEANNVRCSYCGDKATEWDHLRPIVKNKRPTGYISEIANLVPACGKCNQSKSGRSG
jgi:5-methylcytosine-specific restriction endonuclease McrA